MPRLTLRTLLAYIDDTLEPDQARALGKKVAQSEEAKLLIERIKRATRRRGLRAPVPDGSDDDVADPNTVAAYLSDNLDSEQLKQIESTCLESDVHLAEVAACHQILTLVLTEPVRVPPTANARMYNLVDPPASDPTRKPGKSIPVGGIAPPDVARLDADDPDIALLLGMPRYSASESLSGRLQLLGAVAVIGLFLVVAIVMALPHSSSEPPLISRSTDVATGPSAPTNPSVPFGPTAKTPSVVVPVAPVGPSGPTEIAPEPKPVDPPSVPKGVAKVEPESGPVLGESKVPPPLPGRGVVGKMERAKVIVLARSPEPKSRWLRVDPDEPNVSAGNLLMALPGYKAEVKLNSGVVVRLWGNLPEQVSSPKTKVMQSRVRFHAPPPGFDADFTLETGRVYVETSKAAGSKIRVRIASEVWDLELANDKSAAMVQAHSAYIPGTPFPIDGIGGEPPRTEALVVALRGTVNFEAIARYKKYPTLSPGTEIAWDSKTNVLVAPAPVNKQEVVPEPDTLIPGDVGVAIQRVLSDAADSMTDRAGIRPLLEARMDLDKVEKFDFARKVAVYSYAAITDGAERDEAQIMIAKLYDMLVDSDRMIVRQSAVIAASAWLARSPQNTEAFTRVLTVDKLLPPEDANLVAQLLRGFSAATFGPAAWDISKVDDLIKYLNSDLIVVREAALGNLIAYYDLPAASAGAVKGPPPFANVGTKFPGYEIFIRDWNARGEEIKNWMLKKKSEKIDKK